MKILPNNPSIEYLHRAARTLRSKHRSGDPSVVELISHFDTSFQNLQTEQVLLQPFSILDAQRVTARQYGFASWRRLKLFIQKSTQPSADYDPALAEQLTRRNAMRIAMMRRYSPKKAGWFDHLNDFNEESVEMLEAIYDKYGWVSPQIVGREGMEACYWLGINCLKNSQFQYRSAELMREALPLGECYGGYYAVSIDRWLTLSYQPSIFGAFNDFNERSDRVEYSDNVVDPKNLNKRRAQVGLMNLNKANEEWADMIRQRKAYRYTKDEWQALIRKWALEGGYIAA